VTLEYTINKMLEFQQCPIERDVGELDRFGGEVKQDRVVLETVRCRFWWWRETGSRSPSREFATPERTIHFTGGGVMLDPQSQVKAGDHIAQVEDPEGNVIIAGPFRVVAVEQIEDHLEAAVMRP
jgi:hypothetical protein